MRGIRKEAPPALALAVALLAGTPLTRAADSELARNLAATCANCHGTGGHSAGGMASLAGKPREELLAKLRGYADGEQPATIMQQIARGYSAAQLELIAGWFAAQPRPGGVGEP